jgi:hypothetical protein
VVRCKVGQLSVPTLRTNSPYQLTVPTLRTNSPYQLSVPTLRTNSPYQLSYLVPQHPLDCHVDQGRCHAVEEPAGRRHPIVESHVDVRALAGQRLVIHPRLDLRAANRVGDEPDGHCRGRGVEARRLGLGLRLCLQLIRERLAEVPTGRAAT